MASLTNSRESFGWVSITLHWLMAIALIAMYFLGDWMVGLEYYDSWYHKAPSLHKEIGVVLGALMIVRLLWNSLQAKPVALGEHKPIVNRLARSAHVGLYVLVIFLVVSGYLISTSKGQGIDVFGLFEVPAVLPDSAERGELAGDLHKLAGTAFILIVLAHALAALVHHFFFKDRTLLRMLKVEK